MKKFSKALSLFLSLALLLTVFSTTAIAGDLSSEEISGDLVGVDHGVYQDNLTWTVEGDTLIISGEGSMKTYDMLTYAPWYSQRYSIKSVVISEGVTSISTYAFYQMSALETISIAESVKSIGASAFYSCSSLKSIKLPSSITEIPYEMFFYCFSLENVEMSNSVTSIGERAFYFCEKLSSITIPSSVTNIADNAFEGCTALSTIKGEAGSVAEEYAKNKGLTFVTKTPEEVAIENGPVDLGDDFYANINVPALDKTFTNNGEGNVVADAANGSDAQVWHFLKSGNGNEYVIESKLDGRYLTVADKNASLSNVFVSYDAQQYHIYSVNDKYVIAPVGIEDKVVDVNGVDFNVQYWTFNADNACQQYDIVKEKTESDIPTISKNPISLGSDFYAKINVPSLDKTFTNNGAGNVVADSTKDSKAQIWHFVNVEYTSNSYTITSMLDGQYLGVSDLDASLSNVGVYETEQRFCIYTVGDKYVISPVGISDKAIDVNGVDFNVQYWKLDASNSCQQYDIEIFGKDLINDGSLESKEYVDMGDDFYAYIHVPFMGMTFTNDGMGNIVADIANGSDAQKWHFVKHDSTNAYKISSVLDGKNINDENISPLNSSVILSDEEQYFYIHMYYGTLRLVPVSGEQRALIVNSNTCKIEALVTSNVYEQQLVIAIIDDDTSDDTTSDDTTSDDITSDDVTSEETSDETSEETSDDVTSEETSDDVTSEETSDDVTSEETSDDVTSEETSDDTTSEETSDDTTSEETSDDVTSEETSDDVTSDDTTSDETSDDFVNSEDEYYMDDDTSTMPNVVENTLASDMISALEQNNVTATITDKNGNVLGADAKVGTGATVKTSDGKEFTVIVKGDVDGTGVVNATDYLSVKKAFSKDIELSGAFHSAADTDGNKTINATDYIKIKSYFLGDANLYA